MNPRILVPVLVAAYLVVPLAFQSNGYLLGLIVASLTIAGIAVAWALLGNLGGMVSFGHAAFFGVGSYTSAVLTMKMGMPVFVGLLMGGVGAAVASIATMPALRLRGPYFALAILAYAHIFQILAVQMEGVTGGAGGLLSIPRFPTVLGIDFGSKLGGYYIIATIVILAALAYDAIRRSTWGLALKAMHDSELATRVIGVPSTHLKAVMLVVSAFITGVVGAFNAHFINFLEPDYAFSGSWTVLPIAAAIFGGYRTVWGPVLGALVIYLFDQLLFKEVLPHGHQLVLGALMAGMVLWSPGGLVPVLVRRKGGRAHAHA